MRVSEMIPHARTNRILVIAFSFRTYLLSGEVDSKLSTLQRQKCG